jgi:hypothetical protein
MLPSRFATFAAVLLAAGLQCACTPGENASEDELATTPSDGEAAPPPSEAAPAETGKTETAGASDPSAAPPAPATPQGPPITLGALESEDMRHTLWKAFEQRLTKTQTVSDNAEEATELGDYDSFKFTVVKTMSGKDDISGDTSQAPDAVDVEVTGWYKRTLNQSGQDAVSSCFSFDAVAPLKLRGADWIVPDDYQVVFGREDQEDCY